jgi:predicted peptidase
MKKTLFIICCLLLSAMLLQAQNTSLYEKHWFVHNADSMPYRLLLPDNYDAAKKYPLLFFMHGSGERGNDNEKQLVHGAALFLKEDVRKNYPAIIVFPQCPQSSYWSNVSSTRDSQGKRNFIFKANTDPTIAMQMANALLKKIIKEYPVQKKQVYVAGLSMGGMGTFEMVYRNPRLFAAAFPICGGGDPAIAKKVKKTNWWIFHGAKDDVVPPINSEVMAKALQKAKASVKLTIYPNANHNSWDAAFAEPALLPWLFAQRR